MKGLNYEGRIIRQRDDGYICLNDISLAFDNLDNSSLFKDWISLESTISFLASFERHTGIDIDNLIMIDENKDIWSHRKIASRFAQYCDDDIAIAVDYWTVECWVKEIKEGRERWVMQVEENQECESHSKN